MFVFGRAFEAHWSAAVGTIYAVLSPEVPTRAILRRQSASLLMRMVAVAPIS